MLFRSLAKMCSKVYMVVRKDYLRASKAMQTRVEQIENIEILFNHEPKEVLGDDVVEGVRLFNNKTNEEVIVKVTGFFVAIGHKPNTDIFKDWLDLDEVGYIINQTGSSRTNIEGEIGRASCRERV